ncbi:MAG: DUF1385 domain-containing protein [Cyanobacteria bacterium NC_groundwater_1444_Ag_S-0.65um_54_12]|nr:DUF1385 domain-containing protein [Cyanobacteria bacterium NC_groundwater_1444_Ag_S-0.65um_54_12]
MNLLIIAVQCTTMRSCLLDLVRPIQPVDSTDELSTAIHTLRGSGLGALPVVSANRVLGYLGERELSVLIPGQELPLTSELMTVEPRILAAGYETIETAWERVCEADLPFLAVTDPQGVLIGIVSRTDLLVALQADLRPATIGGLATPLGVYLSTGHYRGGAGDLSLVLTGALLMGLNLLASSLVALAARKFVILDSESGLLLAIIIFLTALRFTPLAGIHAAEHQVVHAIEKGKPLHFEQVAQQPREHPRCGTNLAAVVLTSQLALPRLVETPILLGFLLVLLFFTWKRLGWAMQRFFTTRNSTRQQLQSGIRAGQELLKRYNARPNYQAPRWRQVWNLGALQILVGGIVVYWVWIALMAWKSG